jgi:mRNA-degrading endonuclease toxin of MazEF toxin-antitoxin module
LNKGEIWQVSFDPTIGDEIRKTRPAVIISSDAVGILNLRVVAPLTAWRFVSKLGQVTDVQVAAIIEAVGVVIEHP